MDHVAVPGSQGKLQLLWADGQTHADLNDLSDMKAWEAEERVILQGNWQEETWFQIWFTLNWYINMTLSIPQMSPSALKC